MNSDYMIDVFGHSFSINHLVRKHCEKVCNKNRMAAAVFVRFNWD